MQLPWERFNIVKRLSHCAVHVKQLGSQDCKNLQEQSIFTYTENNIPPVVNTIMKLRRNAVYSKWTLYSAKWYRIINGNEICISLLIVVFYHLINVKLFNRTKIACVNNCTILWSRADTYQHRAICKVLFFDKQSKIQRVLFFKKKEQSHLHWKSYVK